MEVVVQAPAKINFTLDITSKLPNGYHTVDMVMQTVDLFDKVVLSNHAGIVLTSNWRFIPCNHKNTAWKAAKLFFEYTKIKGGVAVHLSKRIPTQAGLAGGSTDAAAVLLGLNHLYRAGLSLDKLQEIGALVGADVPFCLQGGMMLATGIGTSLQPIHYVIDGVTILLCKPPIGVSTKQAYALADSRPYSAQVHSTGFIEGLKECSTQQICSSVYNDFEALLKLDKVAEIKQTMLDYGSDCASMSGSGPTVFGIFSDNNQAGSCAAKLRETYKSVYLTKPIPYGCTIV